MPRGPRKHLKRVNAPSHWMLAKMSGIFAPRPSAGPHKLRECLPLIILLRNRLKYALTKREVTMIMAQRVIKVDGKVRTDSNYPAGFMDVIHIEPTNEYFRLLFDTKGRFNLHRIDQEQAKVKLCKVKKVMLGPKGVPFLATHDGRTIRYPDPDIKVNDSILLNIETGKIEKFVKFEVGNLCMTVGGHNMGRIGLLTHVEKHPGAHATAYVKDLKGNTWATREDFIFILGQGKTHLVDLPKGGGIKLSILQERDQRQKKE